MVALNLISNNVEEILANAGGGSVLIPEGNYKAVIIDTGLSDTKTGGKMLVVKSVITEGQHANTEMIDRLNIVNSNQTAVKIAYETLARITKAVGLPEIPQESNLLHNKPMLIEIKNKKQNDWENDKGEKIEGKERSEIASYKPIPGAGTTNASQTQSAPTDTTTPPAANKLPWE